MHFVATMDEKIYTGKNDIKKWLIKLLGKNRTSEDRYDFDCFLERAWQRGIVKFLDDQTIAQEDFHVRFDYWALFEGWKDLPVDIKDKLNDWELNHYIASHAPAAEKLKNGSHLTTNL
jgi:hypothetical protein